MGGHGHEPPFKVPDYRIYRVEDVPLLAKTQRVLAAKGLKDPWLRNEVWRYNVEHWGTESSRTKALFLRGFKFGFGAFVLTVVAQEIYNRVVGNGHGDHGKHHE